MSKVNKAGTDWLILKAEINSRIGRMQEDMLSLLPPEEYHRCRGAILMARELIEWVEPNTPPTTKEEDYDISDPGREY